MNIVVLTGAGISAESGLKTFRASDGLWENHRVEDVATPEGFLANPTLVHKFYNQRRKNLLDAKPNRAHLALAEFEAQHAAGDFLLVTQNIDDLHERAGSRNLVHMHGELLKMKCQNCHRVSPITGDLDTRTKCEACDTPALRPDIVWFGEMPYQMERISDALAQCHLFASIGTSGNVYPAAGFVQIAKAASAICVELNLEPSAGGRLFDRALYGNATQVVPDFFQHLRNLGASGNLSHPAALNTLDTLDTLEGISTHPAVAPARPVDLQK